MADTSRSVAGEEPREGRNDGERAILEVSNLTKIYPDGTLAVDDISFSVAEGDFAVIIGPSGCGKSTTLHSLVGKIPPTEGEIYLDDSDMTTKPAYERDIGLVFQDFQLFPHLSVAENIRYGLDRLGVNVDEIERRVEEMSTMMDLQGLADRSTKELSAGQKQRVALARSLVLEPQLLLLDEPLGDMDYKLQKRMERELLRLHRRLDTTFVYVTHDQTQAMRLADQIVVMNDGRIEQSGTVHDVYNRPATAFVATFVGDSNTFFGEITTVSDDGSEATIETDIGTFTATTTNLYSAPEEVVGQEMPCSVRPQNVRLDESATNTLECAVVDVIYQPDSGTQLILEAEDPEGATREVQLKSFDKLDDPGDRTTIGWDVTDTTLLEKTSVVEDIDLDTDILGE